MNLSAVISQLMSLFLMMLAGYLIARVGIMTPEFRKRLSSFTLNTAWSPSFRSSSYTRVLGMAYLQTLLSRLSKMRQTYLPSAQTVTSSSG